MPLNNGGCHAAKNKYYSCLCSYDKFFLPTPQNYAGQKPNDTHVNCVAGLLNAAKMFIKKERPEHSQNKNVVILAHNDLQCHAPEFMANAVIGTGVTSGHYTIAHVHFSPDGRLFSAAKLFELKTFVEIDVWQKEWCAFIKSVYPKELKEQGCE